MKTVVTGFKQGTIYKIAPEKDAAFLVPMAEDDTTSCVQWSLSATQLRNLGIFLELLHLI